MGRRLQSPSGALFSSRSRPLLMRRWRGCTWPEWRSISPSSRHRTARNGACRTATSLMIPFISGDSTPVKSFSGKPPPPSGACTFLAAGRSGSSLPCGKDSRRSAPEAASSKDTAAEDATSEGLAQQAPACHGCSRPEERQSSPGLLRDRPYRQADGRCFLLRSSGLLPFFGSFFVVFNSFIFTRCLRSLCLDTALAACFVVLGVVGIKVLRGRQAT